MNIDDRLNLAKKAFEDTRYKIQLDGVWWTCDGILALRIEDQSLIERHLTFEFKDFNQKVTVLSDWIHRTVSTWSEWVDYKTVVRRQVIRCFPISWNVQMFEKDGVTYSYEKRIKYVQVKYLRPWMNKYKIARGYSLWAQNKDSGPFLIRAGEVPVALFMPFEAETSAKLS